MRPVPLDSIAWPSVDVLIPVHGDRGELAATLTALQAQDYKGVVEVVVIDNGDNADLAATIGPFVGVTVVAEQQPGSYAARNRGVAETAHEILAFTDADCLPRSSWLRLAVEALLADPSPAFVGGAVQVFPRDPRRPTAAESWDCIQSLRQELYVTEYGWAATANMVTTRRTMQEVGPFDTALVSGGDRDWGTRASATGVEARYVSGAVVDHPARRELRDVHKKIRRLTAGDVADRRSTGRPVFDRQMIFAELRPNTRSYVRRSRGVSTRRGADRMRYIVVAHWLQYYFILSRVRAGRRRAGVVGPR